MTTNQTQKDLVKLLVMQHGMQKASELSGVPYTLVRQWESRRKRRALKLAKSAGVTLSQNPVAVVAERVEGELKQLEGKTRLNLAKYAAKASQSARGHLKEAGSVHKVAQIAAVTHNWNANSNSGNNILNVAVLTGQTPGRPSIKASVEEAP